MVGIRENGNVENGVSDVSSQTKYVTVDSHYDEEFVGGRTNGYHHLEERKTSARKFVFACAVFASLNNVLLGYDVGVMSGAIIFIHEDLKISEVQEEILVGVLSILSLLGSLGGGRTSDLIGRKWTMGLAAIVFQLGAAIMTVAPSFTVLLAGRVLAGIGIGFGVMIAPIYIAEIAPTVARGSLTSFPEIFVNIGILLGYVSNYAFSGLSAHISWRIMLGVGILPSVLIAFALYIIPESPRWLVVQNRFEEARSVLLKTNENESEVEERLAEIQVAAGASDSEKLKDRTVWNEIMFPSPALRRMLVTGIGIQCLQQITGIEATVYYSPEIFRASGLQGNSRILAATVAVGVTKTLAIIIAILLIDKVGRKPLLYLSTIGMTVCLLMVGISISVLGKGSAGIVLTILSVCGNVAFFSVGIGPICWVVTSEIFPLRLRAQASALGAVGNRVCSGVISMSFLSVSNAITVAGTFFIFSIIAAFSVAFVYKCVPETKGKSLEQIELMFQEANELQQREVQLGDVQHLIQEE